MDQQDRNGKTDERKHPAVKLDREEPLQSKGNIKERLPVDQEKAGADFAQVDCERICDDPGNQSSLTRHTVNQTGGGRNKQTGIGKPSVILKNCYTQIN